MKATAISFQNIKGLDGHHPLSPVTLVSGSNFSGKSTILAAAKFALIGHDPKLGKQHQATFQLASEQRPEMSVTITLDNETSFTRALKRSEKGDIKYSELGTPPEIPVILADMAGYFGLKTEQDRINYVFDRINPDSLNFKDDDLLKKLGEIEVLPVQPGIKARDNLITEIKKSIGIRTRDKIKLQDWLNSLIENVKSTKRDADGTMKSTGQAMQPLKHVGKVPISLATEIEAKKEVIRKLEEQIATITEQKRVYDAGQTRMAEIEAELAKPAQDNTLLEQEITVLKAKIDTYKSDTAKALAKLERLREREKNLRGDKTVILNQITEKDLFLKNNTACPYGCPGDHWKTGLAKEIMELRGKQKATEDEQKLVIADGKKAKEAHEKAIQGDTEQEYRLEELKSMQNNLAGRTSLDDKARTALETEYKLLAKPSETKTAVGEHPTIESLTLDVGRHKEQLSGIESDQRKFETYESNKKQLATFESKILDLTAQSAVLKLALDIISEIQQTILGQAFEDLLTKAKPFTDGLLKYSLAYNVEKQELGFHTDKGWASHRTISDCEQALCYAGLAVALAQSAPFKVVFLDEMGKIEFEPVNRKLMVLQRMSELAENGTIDLFLGADNRTSDYLAIKELKHFSQIVLA